MTDKSFIEAFKWNPKQGTKYTVIDQHTGKTVGTFTGMHYLRYTILMPMRMMTLLLLI